MGLRASTAPAPDDPRHSRLPGGVLRRAGCWRTGRVADPHHARGRPGRHAPSSGGPRPRGGRLGAAHHAGRFAGCDAGAVGRGLVLHADGRRVRRALAARGHGVRRDGRVDRLPWRFAPLAASGAPAAPPGGRRVHRGTQPARSEAAPAPQRPSVPQQRGRGAFPHRPQRTRPRRRAGRPERAGASPHRLLRRDRRADRLRTAGRRGRRASGVADRDARTHGEDRSGWLAAPREPALGSA